MAGARAASVTALAATLFASGGSLYGGCNRVERWLAGGAPSTSPTTSPASIPSGPPGTLKLDRPAGAHPRVLLTAEREKGLAALKAANGPVWQALLDQCDEATTKTIEAGYEGWDWGNATLALVLCQRATKNDKYASAAVKYFAALLDDKLKVGDKKGGDAIVQHDDGYPIRTRGWLGAVCLDWLWDAPGMTDALRTRAADRLVAWTTWFKEKGYNHDEPISNYYAGYFGAVAFGGIALEGHDPRADSLRKLTSEMWNKEIVPKYRAKLAGGDFPEGWQYGSMVATIFALFAEAEATSHPVPTTAPPGTAPAAPLFDDLPWLRETVAYHAHALLPDGKHVHEEGDWEDKPPQPTMHELMALAMVLPKDDAAAKRARFLWKLGRGEANHEEWRWLAALAEDPSRPVEDPRTGPTSYLAKGTAVALARTDWTPNALFTAIASAPSLSDHQHLDAGHFAIVRGADHLIIDSGAYGSFSSMSHNTILVEAEKKTSTYFPNQGTWSDTASIARFEDAGAYVYALAEYASAYNPIGYPKDNPKRAVSRADREYVFSRTPLASLGGAESGRIVIYDRMTVLKPTYLTTWIVHPGAVAKIDGASARVQVGKSTAWLSMLLPSPAALTVVNEPTPKRDDRPYYENSPPEGMKTTRIEVRSPRDPASTDRRFLSVFTIGSAASGGDKDGDKYKGPEVVRVEGEGAVGAAVEGEAYVFTGDLDQTEAATIAWRAPASATKHIVVGLAPGAKYAGRAEKAGALCKVTLSPSGDRAASAQGTLVLDVQDCVIK